MAKYGWRELGIATFVCVGLGVVACLLWVPAVALPAALWLFVVAFFRDPERLPAEADAFVSPADGTVTDITPLDADGPLGQPGVRVGVFMSVFSVHVNRCPYAATVLRSEHHDGGFFDARLKAAWERNESQTTFLEVRHNGRPHTIIVRQVAGLIARRIVADVRAGQTLRTSERIGMIKFGSRCELLVPQTLVGQVAAQVGQAVNAGRSVLIRLPKEKERA